MMQINLFSILFICGTLFKLIIEQVLEFVDYKARCKRGLEVPSALVEYVSREQMEKTCAYENDKYFFWIKSNLISTAVDVLVAVFFYSLIYRFCLGVTPNAYFCIFFFTFATSLPQWLVSIPLSAHREFKIEKKHGFGKMTVKLWIDDLIKQTVLMLAVGSVLLILAIALFKNFIRYWYILLAIVYVVFSLVLSFIYPLWIAPIFNKFTPLEDGTLKERLEGLLARCGFKSSGVYVMDASKRSGHSNAYFTGFGKSKRIVLYDTLLKQLTEEEIEAVLAHELGHYKKHHIIKRMAVAIPLVFFTLWLVNLIITNVDLYLAFGLPKPVLTFVEADSVAINTYAFTKYCGIVLILAIISGYGPLINLIENFFSRKDEFQADSYAKKLCGTGEHLVSALIKLNKENLMEFTPPKIYSVFNYSHPPLLERMENLKD